MIERGFSEWEESQKIFSRVSLCGRETPGHVDAAAIWYDQRAS